MDLRPIFILVLKLRAYDMQQTVTALWETVYIVQHPMSKAILTVYCSIERYSTVIHS